MTRSRENKIEEVPGFAHGLRRYKKCLYPHFVKDMSKIKSHKFNQDDAFVIGFPKSGKLDTTSKWIYFIHIYIYIIRNFFVQFINSISHRHGMVV
jgi:deoxyribose-phosphate aldolase